MSQFLTKKCDWKKLKFFSVFCFEKNMDEFPIVGNELIFVMALIAQTMKKVMEILLVLELFLLYGNRLIISFFIFMCMGSLVVIFVSCVIVVERVLKFRFHNFNGKTHYCST